MRTIEQADDSAAHSEIAGASPWLTIEQSAARARTLRAWSTSQQRAIELFFYELREQWLCDWGLQSTDGIAAAVRTLSLVNDAAEEQAWLSTPSEGGLGKTAMRWAFFSGAEGLGSSRLTLSAFPGNDPIVAIEKILFGNDLAYRGSAVDVSDSIGTRVAREAWLYWWRRLVSTVPMLSVAEVPSEPSRTAGPWSGDLYLEIPCLHGRLIVNLSANCVEKIIQFLNVGSLHKAPKSAPITNTIFHAIEHQALQVRTELQAVELSLGQLEGLQLGDVVQLQHPLTEPVKLFSPNEQLLCLGWLGRQDSHVAVELTATNSIENGAR